VINPDSTGAPAQPAQSDAPQSALGRDLLVTYVPLLIGLIYPAGLLKLWLQIDRDYTNNLSLSWYAVSLMPQTFAAGQALMFVLLIVLANIVALAAVVLALTIAKYEYSVEAVHESGQTGPQDYKGVARGIRIDFLLNLSRRPWLRWVLTVAPLVLLTGATLIFSLVIVDSQSELWWYLGFLVLAVGAGALGGFFIAYKPHAEVSFVRNFPENAGVSGATLKEKFREKREEFHEILRSRYVQSLRRWRLVGLAIAVAGAVLSTVCLARVTALTLPFAEFEPNPNSKIGETEIISLLALSEGNWHGFNCRKELVAIPTDETGRVRILAKSALPHLPYRLCRVEKPVISSPPALPRSHS
jgi:hypothetical protein